MRLERHRRLATVAIVASLAASSALAACAGRSGEQQRRAAGTETTAAPAGQPTTAAPGTAPADGEAGAGGEGKGEAKEPAPRLALTSPAFADSQAIPVAHTCHGGDVSPPLAWQNPPSETAAFALVVDDPEGAADPDTDLTWVHWLVYDIPATTTSLPQGAGSTEAPGGGVQGRTSWDKNRYGGPCARPGKPHRYYFQLFALKERLALAPDANKEEVIAAIDEKALDKAVLVGIYQR